MATDPRWTEETERLVADNGAGHTGAVDILTELAGRGLLVTPQVRAVVDAAREWRTSGLFGLGTDRTFEQADAAIEIADDKLRAAVDAYTATQPEEQAT